MSEANRVRKVQLNFRVAEREKQLIEERMQEIGTTNREAYLRKIAIDGYVIRLELPELKEMIRLLGIANNNINQIAAALHSTGNIYEADIQEVQTRIDGLYEEARKILNQLAMIP